MPQRRAAVVRPQLGWEGGTGQDERGVNKVDSGSQRLECGRLPPGGGDAQIPWPHSPPEVLVLGSREGPGNLQVNKPFSHARGCRPPFGGPEVSS